MWSVCALRGLQAEVAHTAPSQPQYRSTSPASAAPPLPSPARDSSRTRPRAALAGSADPAPLRWTILGVIYSSAFPVFCLTRSPCRAVLAGRDAGEPGLGATRLLPGKCRFPQGSRCTRTRCRELRMCLLPPHHSRCFPYQFSTCFLPSFTLCRSSSGSLALLAPALWHRVCMK